MRVREYVVESAAARDRRGLFRVALGALLVAAGVLIAVFPQILVILVASLVATAGLTAIASGLRARSRPQRVLDARDVFFRI